MDPLHGGGPLSVHHGSTPTHHRRVQANDTMYSRRLGQNELEYGFNDMFAQVIFCASSALASPLRLRIVWAILRVQNSLLASQIEMPPGCYDEARFIYTPPASPKDVVEEAGRALTIYDNKSGPELDQDFISGPRKSPGAEKSPLVSWTVEYHMAFTVLHAITDGTSAHGSLILERPARTDLELLRVLKMEWAKRWGQPRVTFEVITPSAEARLPRPDGLSAHHVFPRLSSPVSKQALLDVKFDRIQTAALLTKCQLEQVTLQNAVFALCNFAWIPYPSPLGYGNIVLPAFIPSAADPRAIFWLRARAAHSQMRKQSKSPLLLARSQILSAERSWRAKVFARQDDAASGRLPPSPQSPQQSPVNAAVPLVALLGISHLGDLAALYRTECYPAIEFVDSVGHSRKATGGILLFTRTKVFCDGTRMGRARFPAWGG
ncbi:hypothetical protein B0H17DRAFT_1212268 [Mycena rosella]|uniref:Uncharacterized protein n=1 Tax=Mycena rosella TaxID=1033263 RepID=A0AAD7CW58_MYCRO|nr:hypothetical protein B0H17DRAFT_1212268 [Mycena rosella]